MNDDEKGRKLLFIFNLITSILAIGAGIVLVIVLS